MLGISMETQLGEEIILFISRLADIGNRFVVLEGIEEASQDTKIKEMENDRLYDRDIIIINSCTRSRLKI